jgi:hypothetical protein
VCGQRRSCRYFETETESRIPSHPTAPTVAPEVGFEPTTNRLTADRSTTELLRNSPVGGEPSLPPD